MNAIIRREFSFVTWHTKALQSLVVEGFGLEIKLFEDGIMLLTEVAQRFRGVNEELLNTS